jgi:hypothetical protein
MHRKHCDDSRRAFPLAAPHSDITPREALALQPKKAELHVEKRGRIGCCQADHPVCRWVKRVTIGAARQPEGDPKMFARENCSKVGCFLEGALPIIAPTIALVWMLSIAAFSYWAM